VVREAGKGKLPIMVIGRAGKGKVVANGMESGVSVGEKEVTPEGIERQILIDAVRWLGKKTN
jgi:hypothetical protein